eukprot:scaffold596_cov236-Pinguiococcus_pyrenoidosus.AAC.4
MSLQHIQNPKKSRRGLPRPAGSPILKFPLICPYQSSTAPEEAQSQKMPSPKPSSSSWALRTPPLLWCLAPFSSADTAGYWSRCAGVRR